MTPSIRDRQMDGRMDGWGGSFHSVPFLGCIGTGGGHIMRSITTLRSNLGKKKGRNGSPRTVRGKAKGRPVQSTWVTRAGEESREPYTTLGDDPESIEVCTQTNTHAKDTSRGREARKRSFCAFFDGQRWDTQRKTTDPEADRRWIHLVTSDEASVDACRKGTNTAQRRI